MHIIEEIETNNQFGPIGVFDSGYGGLTVLKEIVKKLPSYNYIYLGDNARAPYGSRSFDTVYQYTWQCVQWFFSQGCTLVLLACNTASAKALRTIQQQALPIYASQKRVLGVIRPTTEIIGQFTTTNKVGIVGTTGTVTSGSYPIEIAKFYPNIDVYQEACPMWVPLIENNEYENAGADYFIEHHLKQLMNKCSEIDTLLLACTHYPLLTKEIKKFLPNHISIVSQGEIVANSLADYLVRHEAIEKWCLQQSNIQFFTTDSTTDFDSKASMFWGEQVHSQHAEIH